MPINTRGRDTAFPKPSRVRRESPSVIVLISIADARIGHIMIASPSIPRWLTYNIPTCTWHRHASVGKALRDQLSILDSATNKSWHRACYARRPGGFTPNSIPCISSAINNPYYIAALGIGTGAPANNIYAIYGVSWGTATSATATCSTTCSLALLHLTHLDLSRDTAPKDRN